MKGRDRKEGRSEGRWKRKKRGRRMRKGGRKKKDKNWSIVYKNSWERTIMIGSTEEKNLPFYEITLF